jgi:hypothetical protein
MSFMNWKRETEQKKPSERAYCPTTMSLSIKWILMFLYFNI